MEMIHSIVVSRRCAYGAC